MIHAELPEAVRKLYPWPGDYLTLEGGHRLHFVDEGHGEPLLMVHGNPTWSFYYRGLIKALSGERRCVVPDHVGCGLSDKPRDWSYRLRDHIDNLDRLVAHLNLWDITLLVHDWGGAIGIGAALKRPERFKRLVFFNTAVFGGPMPLRIRMCRWPLLGPMTVRGLNAFLRIALHVGFAKQVTADVAAGYLAPYDSWDHRRAIHRFVQDIPIERDHPTRPVLENLDRQMPTLSDLPTMIVWGEQDFVFSKVFLERWRVRFPHAEVHSLPYAAHFVVEDASEEIVALLRAFLDRQPRPETT